MSNIIEDHKREWHERLVRWVGGFRGRNRGRLPESQQEMLKYNADNIDVSEILEHFKDDKVKDMTPVVVYKPQSLSIKMTNEGWRVPFPERHEVELKDVSALSVQEIGNVLTECIKEYPLGFCIGVGFKKKNGGLDVIVYVYKPVRWLGVDVNVYR